MTDLRATIANSLQNLSSTPLREAALNLLSTLDYQSDKTIQLDDSSPQAFLEFIQQNKPNDTFDQQKALFSDWTSADLLFQLTDEELSPESSLFQETAIAPSLLQSYLFFSIELNGDSSTNGHYSRGKLTTIARQINRVFPMPVMVLFRHPAGKETVLSLAVINRRQNKRETQKDVLGKVTIIRDISLTFPHRGHLDILNELARPNLRHPEKKPITTFDTLHAAWEEIFNVELLNKRFYQELSNWYFWALPQVDFPGNADVPVGKGSSDEKERATGLIRLLTRLIFCWFIKEKDLIPTKLFNPTDLDTILKDFDPDSDASSQYYHAILQNLFFATLNQRMGKPKEKDAKPYRQFALDEGFAKNRTSHDINNLYRYESLFTDDPDTALSHFADIPFLNGGLFECLDKRDEDTKKTHYLDGFSRNKNKRPHLPNHLFFSPEIKNIDLADAYGDKKRKKESVSGLLNILNRYKFTIVENTPIDQEIALDPELLGKVFENLLASYNEETKTTARKQTGSFYTPRPIVDYMVDESLKAHLAQALAENTSLSRKDAEAGLDLLFAYTEKEHLFSDDQVNTLLTAIHSCKILDPACGSGAFPMGFLHKLVFIIHKLDPNNEKWKQLQIDAAQNIPDSSARTAAIKAIERAFDNNEDDYGRKLYLIENCLYGVDIQPVAIQITKLRFFVSLVCDQKTNKNKADNHGVLTLPNLETKFVAADTLISLPFSNQKSFADTLIEPIEKKLAAAHHKHFSVNNRKDKVNIQKEIKDLREELGDTLQESLGKEDAEKAQKIANWDAFDPQASADFFDPHWMFGKDTAEGFDIVIGNPPYISVEKFSGLPIQDKWKANFETYAARGDIYCFFYERGSELLKQGGSLVYITSNKWMRAGYGKNLRQYLSEKVDTESVLDFGMAQNFGAATTYTCILRFYNQEPDDRILSCYATDDREAMANPAEYFDKNHVIQQNQNSDAWVVLSKERQRIKTLVEEQGTPLKDWDIQINYGIKTGYNDAFYLTEEERSALIQEDPASEELIGKLLRGRDVERYGVNWQNTYQLVIKFGAHEYLEERYPAIYKHLSKFETRLKARGQCKYSRAKKSTDASKPYPGQHHWLELDNNPSDEYIESFYNKKVIYPEISKWMGFYYDSKDEIIPNNKGFIINSETESLPFLVAFGNSTIFRCCFRDNFPEVMGNTYEMRKIFVEKIPIKKPIPGQAAIFSSLVPLIQFAKANAHPAAYQFLEDLIDACVMECYFHEHMAKLDLLFLDQLAPSLESYNPGAPEAEQTTFLETFLNTHNAPTANIRNQLPRLTTDSPDLLAIIKQEGQV